MNVLGAAAIASVSLFERVVLQSVCSVQVDQATFTSRTVLAGLRSRKRIGADDSDMVLETSEKRKRNFVLVSGLRFLALRK